MMTATVPMAPPSASEPTSPMKISAGCALYHRKPIAEPTMEPQKMVTSDDLGHLGQLKIVGENRVPADVGEHGQRAGGDDRAADGQPVEAVGEVHRVAGADNDDRDKEHERQKRQRRKIAVVPAADHQVRAEMLEERHDQARRIQPVGLPGS